MIKVRSFTKKYGNRVLFKDLSIDFNDYGLYCIVGKSGCGKSTLLNCLSTLDTDYEGDILLENKVLKSLKNDEIFDLRMNKIGFIFQSFNLFENETVFNNIKLVQFKGEKSQENQLDNEILDLLNSLDLMQVKDQFVKFLSGGEKQRVAIARAIINKPSVIFCDEPTGSLDSKSAYEIFEILQNISKTSLVIVVTHDKNLANQFANYIFDVSKNTLIENKKLLMNTKVFKDTKNRSAKIGFKYIFRNIKSNIKSRKLRYFISSSLFSLSLICLGLTIFVSDNISRSINKAFSNLISTNSLILRKKDEQKDIQISALKEEEALKIGEKYPNDISYVGTKMLVNFNEFFPQNNTFYLEKNGILDKFLPLNCNNINNFIYLNDENISEEKFYPQLNDELKDDEIVLSMNYKNMEDLCLQLRIEKSYESLGNYIKENNLKLVLKTRNDFWNYKDEQVFYLKAVLMKPSISIYHTNPLFNESIFKDYMRFPTSHNIYAKHELPRVMNQIYYINTNKFPGDFLNKLQYDNEFSNILFEPDNSYFSPDICINDELCYSNRIFLLKSLNDIFQSSIINKIKEINPKFKNYYFSSPGGYMNYGGTMFNGFAKEMYFSFDKSKLKSIENIMQQIQIDDYESAHFNDQVAKGFALDTNNDNVKFSINYDGKYRGFEHLNSNNVVISSALAQKLGCKNPLGKELFLMMNYETNSDEKFYFKKFKIAKLIVAGIVESDAYKIYQNKDFSISLFRDIFQVSSLELIPDSVVFEFDSKPSKNEIINVNEHIKNYEIIDPFEDIDNSMNEIFFFFDVGLSMFTIFTSISTILLMFVINAINFEDDKKEIAIYKMLGFKDSEINKTQLYKNFSYTLPSLFTATISIILISVLLGTMFQNLLGLDVGYSFPFLALIGILLLTVFMTFISYFFVTKHIKKSKLTNELHKMT